MRASSGRTRTLLIGCDTMTDISPYTAAVIYMCRIRPRTKSKLYSTINQLCILDSLLDEGFLERRDGLIYATPKGGTVLRMYTDLAGLLGDARHFAIVERIEADNNYTRTLRRRGESQ